MEISKAKCPNCNKPMQITKAQCFACNITLEGEFSLPALARLSEDDQNFVIAFIQVHGSIKKMEELFNISYPTVKNRLNNLAEQLSRDFDFNQLAQTNPVSREKSLNWEAENSGELFVRRADKRKLALLEKLENGEMSVDEVIHRLKKL